MLHCYVGTVCVCQAAFCEAIVLLTGNVLVSVTDADPTSWNVVIESGLALVLFKSLRSFVTYEDITEVSMQLSIIWYIVYRFLFIQELLSTIDNTLMLLHNCFPKLAEYNIPNLQGHNLLRNLKPYIKSPKESISFNAKVLTLHLGSFLNNEDRKLLTLDLYTVQDLVKSFNEAIVNSNSTAILACGISMSAIEIIKVLQDACVVEKNICLMIENNLLEIILLAFVKDLMPSDVRDLSFNLVLSIFVHDDLKNNKKIYKKVHDFIKTAKSTACTSSHIKHHLFLAPIDSLENSEFSDHYKFSISVMLLCKSL